MARRLTWAQERARVIVKQARDLHGPSWYTLTDDQRDNVSARGIVTLVLSQDTQYPDTLTNLQAVCREVYALTHPESK